MAVLNVSPESFYEGSVRSGAAAVAEAARRFADAGAELIDVGAMSTAPYLETEISPEEETRRMVSAVEAVAATCELPISADTTKPAVAAAALAAGARILNDVSGLRTAGMGAVAATAEAVILMASPDPAIEASAGEHASPVERVRADLLSALARAEQAGIDGATIAVDPGIGFYRQTGWPPAEFACATLAGLASLTDLGYPILVGVSRKSFLGEVTGRGVEERLAASLAATAIAVYNGCSIVRTHDVAATRDAVRVAQALR